jgi:hypothetical protein
MGKLPTKIADESPAFEKKKVGEKATQETAHEYCERMCDVCKSTRTSRSKEVLADHELVATQRPSLCQEADREVIDDRFPSVDPQSDDDGGGDGDGDADADAELYGDSWQLPQEIWPDSEDQTDDSQELDVTDRCLEGVVQQESSIRELALDNNLVGPQSPGTSHASSTSSHPKRIEEPPELSNDDSETLKRAKRGADVQQGEQQRPMPKRRKSVRNNPWSDDESNTRPTKQISQTAPPLSCRPFFSCFG